MTQGDSAEIPDQPDTPYWRVGLAAAEGASRCGARTRSGQACRGPAMPNGRCRMHGGKSPGAPLGERNGNYRHGRYTREATELQREVRDQTRRLRAMLLADEWDW